MKIDPNSPADILQEQVWTWARNTFGTHSILDISIRGNKEMAELISSIANGRPGEEIVEECADVAFFLMQICEAHDCSLVGAIADKLEKNRSRKWGRGSDGSFQHVEE